VAPKRTFATRVIPLAVPVAPGSEDEIARQMLEVRIGRHVPNGRVALAVTDNQFTMISVRRSQGLFRLRLHHMFLDAEPQVVRALGRYVAHNDRESSRLLGQFIDVHQRQIRRARARRRAAPVVVETRGEVHDLQEVFDSLNARYFGNGIDARITWGQRRLPGEPALRRSSIKMGSYAVEDRLIRLHPSLDRGFVPRVFVEWIVFHEMLHQKHDIPVRGGRRQFHTPEFLAEEATFSHYHEVRIWERMHLDQLLEY
jgi:predicted metal-dependent hydrolase